MIFLIILTAELIAISIGAGASFIIDLYFVVNSKTHKLERRDFGLLHHLTLLQSISAYTTLLTSVTLLAMALEYNKEIPPSFVFMRIIIFAVILFGALTMRRVHFPTLHRHQYQYDHLSDSLSHHNSALVSTCAVQTVSWLFIIVLSARLYNPFQYKNPAGFLVHILTYILALAVAIFFAHFIKERMTRHHQKRLLKK